ncbi:hypothetical protein [Parasulfitobacter algicola]|uniref:Uncharacterized protein n=1 Tax=Parasulfitobacter algicola TaxID=2614809 RepID=A0ABX2J119_9RHOB|nr:hypothetical protein [Sulfitobacter algicola]NSX56946.1 hypothetical protein [Sulfitobacter algicola]
MEEPSRIWVSDRLTQSTKNGYNIPIFSTLQFTEGGFLEGFVSNMNGMIPYECESAFECALAENHAAVYSGRYTLSDGSIVLSEVTATGVVPDPAVNSEFALMETLSETGTSFSI